MEKDVLQELNASGRNETVSFLKRLWNEQPTPCPKCGVTLTLFPLPSTHSKGAVGLLVDDEYAFLGDAAYGMTKGGRYGYNVNALRDLIIALEALPARYFLLSHDESFVRNKADVLEELKELYTKRRAGEAYIYP